MMLHKVICGCSVATAIIVSCTGSCVKYPYACTLSFDMVILLI